MGELLRHLFGGFEVELIGLELQPLFIQNRFARLDTQQDLMGAGVAFDQKSV